MAAPTTDGSAAPSWGAASRPVVTDSQRLMEVLGVLARRATDDFHIDDILRDLCIAATQVLDVAGAGVAHQVDGVMRVGSDLSCPNLMKLPTACPSLTNLSQGRLVRVSEW